MDLDSKGALGQEVLPSRHCCVGFSNSKKKMSKRTRSIQARTRKAIVEWIIVVGLLMLLFPLIVCG